MVLPPFSGRDGSIVDVAFVRSSSRPLCGPPPLPSPAGTRSPGGPDPPRRGGTRRDGETPGTGRGGSPDDGPIGGPRPSVPRGARWGVRVLSIEFRGLSHARRTGGRRGSRPLRCRVRPGRPPTGGGRGRRREPCVPDGSVGARSPGGPRASLPSFGFYVGFGSAVDVVPRDRDRGRSRLRGSSSGRFFRGVSRARSGRLAPRGEARRFGSSRSGQTMTDLMSRARFRTAFGSLGSREAVFVLRHAWLNPQAKHMTTGRIAAKDLII
jgi:hypothetical protein